MHVGFVGGVPQVPANRLLVKHRVALGSSLFAANASIVCTSFVALPVDVRIHPEVRLIAFLRPMHLRIPFGHLVLGRQWRIDGRGVRYGAASDRGALQVCSITGETHELTMPTDQLPRKPQSLGRSPFFLRSSAFRAWSGKRSLHVGSVIAKDNIDFGIARKAQIRAWTGNTICPKL